MVATTPKNPKTGAAKPQDSKKETIRKRAPTTDSMINAEQEAKKPKIGNGSQQGFQQGPLQSSNQVLFNMALTAPHATLFDSPLFSDLVITCRDCEWKGHRMVVCFQSEPLMAMEADSGTIDLSVHEPEVVNCMLKFLYTYDYSDGSLSFRTGSPSKSTSPSFERSSSVVSNAPTTVSTSEDTGKPDVNGAHTAETYCGPILTNTKIYILGEKYQIPHLKQVASKKFASALHNAPSLDDFISSIRLMHSEIPENDTALKDVAIGYAVDNVGPLTAREDFRDFCKSASANKFVLNMLLHMTDLVLKPCPRCKTNVAVKSVRKPRGAYNHYFSCGSCGLEWN